MSIDLRPALEGRRSNFAGFTGDEAEVEGYDFDECWSESVESSQKATRTAEALRRDGGFEVVLTRGSFPLPSLNLDNDVD